MNLCVTEDCIENIFLGRYLTIGLDSVGAIWGLTFCVPISGI